jgi:hypothetical protein
MEAGRSQVDRSKTPEGSLGAGFEQDSKTYNTVRHHSAIGYVTPPTKLACKEKEFFAQRDKKLEAARERPRLRRAEAIQNVACVSGIY